MNITNEDVINNFFEAYKKHDFNSIKLVMDDNVVWTSQDDIN